MRDTYLDSCKATLIFLVVLGHFLERMIGWDDSFNHALLGTIYFIHMPAFIFISGMLFKEKKWRKNILFFISLYLPFQILFPAFDAIWSGHFQINWNLFERPYWILWYLLGMIAWTMITHFLIKTKFPLLITLIFALCIGLSPWNNYQYSIGRIFTFLPFFVVGALYGKEILVKIQQSHFSQVVSLSLLGAIAILVYFTQLNPFWLYGSLSYSQLKVSIPVGIGMRLACLLISSLGIYATFVWIKSLNQHFVHLGQNTLAVYLLHGFVVMLVARYWQLDFNLFIEVSICIILSVLTCWILQQSIFDRGLRKLSLWLIKPAEKLGFK
ncbi:acyltransferase family protein [Acinetobacter bereziniae]|uniref:acyltransferase family protein n=1 Tax=Acinetobacter bereziniae TaxID=106648 RepID=UPI00124FEB20|nr:acyltransferase family protein [Acinetobacter bereziniae]